VLALPLNSFFLFGRSGFVDIFGCLVDSLPHLTDLFGNLGHPIAGELIFDLWIDIHAVEKKCAHGFFRRFWLKSFLSRHFLEDSIRLSNHNSYPFKGISMYTIFTYFNQAVNNFFSSSKYLKLYIAKLSAYCYFDV
jgi:hypothetical protein